MPKPDEPSDGALKRLDNKLDALEASRTTKPFSMGMGDSASEGFRLLGQILGGMLGGLGLGWFADSLAGTKPFGLLGGLLIGTGLSVFAAVRQASAMSAKAAAKAPPAPAADDDDDEA
ncbi:MAG TPA: AtpZ/AtpI family protein [Caulobacteraceae bacterium]|jgi:ATP synthase protein I